LEFGGDVVWGSAAPSRDRRRLAQRPNKPNNKITNETQTKTELNDTKRYEKPTENKTSE